MNRAHPLLPFLSVTAGLVTFSVMDALMKSASIASGVYDALLLRSAIGGLLLLPVWLLTHRRWPAMAVLRLHALRSAVVTAMAGLFFWGLVRLPMAEAMALSFIAPLIALYLAAVVLGETIRPSAMLASLLGLVGVAVITAARFVDGSAAASAPGIAAVLLSAVFYAWNLILQRQQALLATPFDVALFQSLFMALFLILAAPIVLFWHPLPAWPDAAVLRDVTGAAVLAALSLMLLSWGYARAEAQALLPLEYTAFVWAALAGWLLFGEAVTASTVAGTLLIVLGCWIATRKAGTPHVPPANLPPAP